MKAAGKSHRMISEIDKVTKVVTPHPDEDSPEIVLAQKAENYYDNIDAEIAYIIQHHFAKVDTKNIDFLYIEKVASVMDEVYGKTQELVDTFAVTFSFEQMDIMDRVIFTL